MIIKDRYEPWEGPVQCPQGEVLIWNLKLNEHVQRVLAHVSDISYPL